MERGPFMCRFDWYQATVVQESELVVERLHDDGPCGFRGKTLERPGLARKYRQYNRAFDMLNEDGEAVGQVWAGEGVQPSVRFSGENAPEGAEWLRREYLGMHYVTRGDACIDLVEAGGFERVVPMMAEIAKSRRMAFQSIGDALNDRAGRTQYLGSRESSVYVRAYEKGWEQIAKVPYGLRDKVSKVWDEIGKVWIAPENWIRLECVRRPDAKQMTDRWYLASAQPVEVWGSSEWAARLLREAVGEVVEARTVRVTKVSKADRAALNLVNQYGKWLDEWAKELGSAAAVGEMLMRVRVAMGEIGGL